MGVDTEADLGPFYPSQKARLHRFRIEPTSPARVRFEATNDVRGMITQGFTINNKTIASLDIDSDVRGGYFTVNEPTEATKRFAGTKIDVFL